MGVFYTVFYYKKPHAFSTYPLAPLTLAQGKQGSDSLLVEGMEGL